MELVFVGEPVILADRRGMRADTQVKLSMAKQLFDKITLDKLPRAPARIALDWRKAFGTYVPKGTEYPLSWVYSALCAGLKKYEIPLRICIRAKDGGAVKSGAKVADGLLYLQRK